MATWGHIKLLKFTDKEKMTCHIQGETPSPNKTDVWVSQKKNFMSGENGRIYSKYWKILKAVNQEYNAY